MERKADQLSDPSISNNHKINQKNKHIKQTSISINQSINQSNNPSFFWFQIPKNIKIAEDINNFHDLKLKDQHIILDYFEKERKNSANKDKAPSKKGKQQQKPKQKQKQQQQEEEEEQEEEEDEEGEEDESDYEEQADEEGEEDESDYEEEEKEESDYGEEDDDDDDDDDDYGSKKKAKGNDNKKKRKASPKKKKPEPKRKSSRKKKSSEDDDEEDKKKKEEVDPEELLVEEKKESLSPLTVADLKERLKKNDQKCSGSKAELIDRVADGMVRGRIPRCPKCGAGRLRYDSENSLYRCPGYMDDTDFVFCRFKANADEVKRDKWLDWLANPHDIYILRNAER